MNSMLVKANVAYVKSLHEREPRRRVLYFSMN